MQTRRQQISSFLAEAELSAKDLSALVRASEKEVYEHLDHIQRSIASKGKVLVIKPARCLECDYQFKNRKRLSSPSRCPVCRGEHIEDPKFRIL